MKYNMILLLSFLSCGLFQASDIFKAIALHDKKAIQAWLKNSPDVDLVNDRSQTVLMKAVLVCNTSLVKELLKVGASVNAVDRFGRTALDYAVELSNKNIAKLLVKSNGMVTSEVAAVKCVQLMVKKISVFRAILTSILGAVGLFLCFPGVGVACGMIFGMGGGCLPLLMYGLTVLGISSAIEYGHVKIATRKEKSYQINVLEPAA